MAGSKHHVLVDAQGILVNVIPTKANRHDVTQIVDAQGILVNVIPAKANRHDVTQMLPLVDGVRPIRGKRGLPLKKPKSVQANVPTMVIPTAWRWSNARLLMLLTRRA